MSKAEKIKAYLERRIAEIRDISQGYIADKQMSTEYLLLHELLSFIDSLEEEPVSNDLEEAAHSYVDTTIEHFDSEGNPCCYPAFIAGAQWQKERDQSTIELAEDHAYLAGQEKIIEKACEWLNNFYSEDRHCYFVEEDIDNFKKAMEE